MNEEKILGGFLAISRLYLKMTDSTDNPVDDEEIELFIGSVDKSNLSRVLVTPEPA